MTTVVIIGGAFITSLAPTIAIIVNHVLTKRNTLAAAEKVEHKMDEVADQSAAKLETIHVLVNSRLTEALREIATLKKALGLTLSVQDKQMLADAQAQAEADS